MYCEGLNVCLDVPGTLLKKWKNKGCYKNLRLCLYLGPFLTYFSWIFKLKINGPIELLHYPFTVVLP